MARRSDEMLPGQVIRSQQRRLALIIRLGETFPAELKDGGPVLVPAVLVDRAQQDLLSALAKLRCGRERRAGDELLEVLGGPVRLDNVVEEEGLLFRLDTARGRLHGGGCRLLPVSGRRAVCLFGRLRSSLDLLLRQRAIQLLLLWRRLRARLSLQ